MPSRLWFESALLPTGWAPHVTVEIVDGRFASIQADTAPGTAERHTAAIAGLCNVHSHTFQRGMAGLAEARGPRDDDFWTWREWMYKFLDRLTPDDIQAIAAQAFVEMLETGFTRVGEFHYLHHDGDGAPYTNPAETAESICAAAEATGIGLTLLPVFYAQGGFGGQPPNPGQRRFLNDITRFEEIFAASRAAVARLDDGGIGIAPHSLRAVTPQDLDRLLAAHPTGPVHIHVAEQQKEVADCLAWSGRRPVDWLLGHCDVDERWCLIHATHVTADEVHAIARRGAVVGLCPLTEANLGDGVFPAREFLLTGGRIGIGTDSNIQIDVAGELRALEYAQRLQRRSRNVVCMSTRPSTGAALFDCALSGGGQALQNSPGRNSPGIVVGASADFVSLNLDSPAFSGRNGDTFLDQWIFAGRSREIDNVWRHGRVVVSGGAHRDRADVEMKFKAVVRRIAS